MENTGDNSTEEKGWGTSRTRWGVAAGGRKTGGGRKAEDGGRKDCGRLRQRKRQTDVMSRNIHCNIRKAHGKRSSDLSRLYRVNGKLLSGSPLLPHTLYSRLPPPRCAPTPNTSIYSSNAVINWFSHQGSVAWTWLHHIGDTCSVYTSPCTSPLSR